MKLYIDTSQADSITLKLNEEVFTTDSKIARSQKLLPFIIERLSERSKVLNDISEVEVFTGPGSFTGLRVGISIANTLGFALGIPVNGKDIMVSGPVTPTY